MYAYIYRVCTTRVLRPRHLARPPSLPFARPPSLPFPRHRNGCHDRVAVDLHYLLERKEACVIPHPRYPPPVYPATYDLQPLLSPEEWLSRSRSRCPPVVLAATRVRGVAKKARHAGPQKQATRSTCLYWRRGSDRQSTAAVRDGANDSQRIVADGSGSARQ